MSLLDAITLASLLLEDDELVALEVLDYRSLDLGFQGGLAHFGLAVILLQEHPVELDLASFLALKTVDKDFLILLHLELVACYLYYRKHDL